MINGEHEINGDRLTGVATGREYDTEQSLRMPTPAEKIKYAYLISSLRSNYQLLKEAGDPLLLTQYAFVHNFLSVGRDADSLLNRFLPGDEFAVFKKKFIEDLDFRADFDLAYKEHRLTALRGEASRRGGDRLKSQVDTVMERVRSFGRRFKDTVWPELPN